MTIEQPVVEFKRLAARRKLQPGESLLVSSRKPLAPESDGKVLVIMVTCDIQPAGQGLNDHAQTVKSTELHSQRIVVWGPMTSGPDVKRIPEPSMVDIIQAWREFKPKDKWLTLQPTKIRIKLTCIGDFEDKRQFYPLGNRRSQTFSSRRRLNMGSGCVGVGHEDGRFQCRRPTAA